MTGPTRTPHADQVHAVLEAGSAPARSALAAAWRRSQALHGLDPSDTEAPITLTAQELAEATERAGQILQAAQAPLDRLFRAVGDTGCCVLLTDAEGVLIDRRGSTVDDDTFRDWGLWTGAVWSEAAEGANGIGTCLAEDRALTIHRDQHFRTRNTGLSCTAAPIHDHQGRLAAALDVSSCRADLTAGFVGIIGTAVSDAAQRIEAQAFRNAFASARIVLAGGDGAGPALLAVDRHDMVIGATRAARVGLALTDERLARGLAADSLLDPPPGEPLDLLQDAERGALERALAHAGGRVAHAARALGISRATLHRKLNRLGLAPRR